MFQADYWERKSLEERRSPDHPVVRQYAEPKVAYILRKAPLGRNDRVLDVGCGNGFFSAPFERVCPTVGVDYSGRMLARNPLARKLRMDANRLCFQDMSFDLVLCHALLHHVEDPARALSEMRRVSRRYVVVMEPNRNNPLMALFSALVPEERKALAFSLSHLKGLLEGQGLRVIAACSHGWTVPNKAPALLLPFLKLLDFPQPLGMTNILIARR